MTALPSGIGPRFDHEGEPQPMFNIFNKPIICTHAEPEGCCNECAAWLDCLQRSPLRLELSGFDFEKWLKWVRFNAVALKPEQQDVFFTTGPQGNRSYHAFTGVYLLEPVHHSPDPFNSTLIGACGNVTRPIVCGTHIMRTGRTLLKLQGQFGPVSHFYVDSYVECQTDAQGRNPALVFYAVLHYEYEGAQVFHAAGCLWTDPNGPPVITVPAQLEAEEPRTDCCPILKSAPIPLAGLTWEALQDIQLHDIPFECVLPTEGASSNFCTTGAKGVCAPIFGLFHHKMASLCIHPTNGAPLCLLEDVQSCSPDSPGVIRFDGVCTPILCIPPDIELLEPVANNKISVVAKSCDFVSNCHACPDENNPRIREPFSEIDFVGDATPGCCKSFEVALPACLGDIVKNENVYWSFGQTGKRVSYCLRNVRADSPTTIQEEITVTVIDDRGCIYCKTKVVTCGCPCPGAGGNLTAVLVEENSEEGFCRYELIADVADGEGDGCEDSAFLEVCILAANDPIPDCDRCIQLPENDCNGRGLGGCIGLGDGDFFPITITEPVTVAWRIWDRKCGCASNFVFITLGCSKCRCCTGELNGARITVGGVKEPEIQPDSPDCPCDSINGQYDAPNTSGCGGTAVKQILCEESSSEVTVGWSVYCDDFGYWLQISYSWFPYGGQNFQADIFLGTEKPQCSQITGSGGRQEEPPLFVCDDKSGLQLSVVLY